MVSGGEADRCASRRGASGSRSVTSESDLLCRPCAAGSSACFASAMTYDNSSYWLDLHRTHPGSLKAVGHPWLSEALNELKYRSEAETLTRVLESLGPVSARGLGVTMLDIGAGTGFWTEAIHAWLSQRGAAPKVTALDISEQALAAIKRSHPEFETTCTDLKTVDPDSFHGRYTLVFSFYCLHHLPRIADFLNGLRFAARSVGAEGVLLIMDPMLSRPYSAFHAVEFAGHDANGMPRPLALIDEVLEGEGLDRVALEPAVSFLLNDAIEARSRVGFAVATTTWQLLQRLYRSEGATGACSRLLAWCDRALKRRGRALSSSLAAYRRTRS
jgi:SAM-dependent methyltransferase